MESPTPSAPGMDVGPRRAAQHHASHMRHCRAVPTMRRSMRTHPRDRLRLRPTERTVCGAAESANG